jgi:hypothetical protein
MSLLKRFFQFLIRVLHIPIDSTGRSGLASRWRRLISSLPQVEVSTATYKDIVEYFVDDRPEDDQIVAGALFRQKRSNSDAGILLVQSFLDSNNNPVYGPTKKPYGRLILARNIDNELRQMFYDRDLIIFE